MALFFDTTPRDLSGLPVLLTAGPTQEALDPVRFLSNHSTGKMGYALAEELAERGARVTLVSGPTHQKANHPGIQVVPVVSAQQMYEACLHYFSVSQLVILAAAVADYTPKVVADHKIKKKEPSFFLELVKTVDIAAELGKQKREDQYMVGFALETQHELANAQAKLASKNLDLIVLNSMRDPGATFGYDTNQVTLIHRHGAIHRFGLKSKLAVARDIINEISRVLPINALTVY